jgi:hypothetical protein
LDHDLPIPLFPISPEDLGCAITVGIFVLLYAWLYCKGSKVAGVGTRSEILAALLPIVVALVVDVYLI